MDNEIRVGFSTTNALSSRLIRFFTRSKVSHTWFSFRDETLDKTLVMHATRIGYNVETWKKFTSHNTLVAMFGCDYDLRPGLQKVANWLGTKYDFEGILGFLWVLFLRWFNIKRKNPFRDTKRLFCSEAVIVGLKATEALEIPRVQKLDPETTDPEDLLELCASEDKFHRRRVEDDPAA